VLTIDTDEAKSQLLSLMMEVIIGEDEPFNPNLTKLGESRRRARNHHRVVLRKKAQAIFNPKKGDGDA
jgi:hypothetical protein